MSKTIVVTWGRMNPPTIGHQKVVDYMTDIAESLEADARVYLSHSQDKDENPLPYTSKVRLAQEAFGDIVHKSSARNIIQVFQECDKDYDNLILVVGGDRVDSFQQMAEKYNGIEYNFDKIIVESAGIRDEESDDVEGVSASLARDFALAEEFEAFASVLPAGLQEKAGQIYMALRGGMLTVAEEHELNEFMQLDEVLDATQRRAVGRRFKRLAPKIKRAKERAKKRLASTDKLQGRARKAARTILKKKAAGGKDPKELAFTQRQSIEKRLQNPARKRQLATLAKRLLPQTRKKERERLAKFRAKSTNEDTIYDVVEQALQDMERK